MELISDRSRRVSVEELNTTQLSLTRASRLFSASSTT